MKIVPKEHPILFSGPMVKALLEDRKTQTRRPIKPRDAHQCPYGSVGGILWVREAYTEDDAGFIYRADNECIGNSVRWRPSIFMPRRASRITLTITDIKIQRLQDITEPQAMAEGVTLLCSSESCRDAFRRTWDWLHKPYGLAGWDSNPLVWAIGFKRI